MFSEGMDSRVRGNDAQALAGGHAQSAIQANDFTVQMIVVHDVAGQFGKFAGLAQTGREGDAGS
jgi:hypothetical protein